MHPIFRVALALLILATFPSCARFIYYPDHALYYEPSKYGYKAQEVDFRSSDGTLLFGWFFANTGPKLKGTIIQFHGNAENMSSHYVSLAWATRVGYNLFVWDYRGYGKSSGEPSPEGVYKDGMSALDKAWELHQKSGAKKFIVHGQSLGGAVAMRSFYDFSHKAETALVVMDSTFVSYQDVAQEALAKWWVTWIFSPLGQVLISDKYAPEKYIPLLKNRLLVIHDRSDPVIAFHNGQALYALAMGPKDFWDEDQKRHIGFLFPGSDANRKKYLHYLDAL